MCERGASRKGGGERGGGVVVFGRQMSFGVLGLLCEAPPHPKKPGFHTTAREPQRAHLRVPDFTKTTTIQREDTQRETKRAKMGAGEGKKKSEMLGGPAEGGPEEGVLRKVRTHNT